MDDDPANATALASYIQEVVGTRSAQLGELSPDRLFDALADERRRYALASVVAGESPMSLSELAEAVAERDDSAARDSEADRKRILIELHHTHVPALADVGFVDYDRERREVRQTDATSSLEPAFERVD